MMAAMGRAGLKTVLRNVSLVVKQGLVPYQTEGRAGTREEEA